MTARIAAIDCADFVFDEGCRANVERETQSTRTAMSGNLGVRVMSLLKAQNRETEKRGTYIMPRQLHSTHSKRAVGKGASGHDRQLTEPTISAPPLTQFSATVTKF